MPNYSFSYVVQTTGSDGNAAAVIVHSTLRCRPRPTSWCTLAFWCSVYAHTCSALSDLAIDKWYFAPVFNKLVL